MSSYSNRRTKAMYLTVLPFYRENCIQSLSSESGNRVEIYAGPRQLTATVKTGIDPTLYRPLRAFFLFGRAIILRDHWLRAINADSLMLDLNPRCLTAWGMLLARKVLKRRTLVWGHLYPRAGAGSWTARLRRSMRKLADGTVLYGFDSVIPAQKDIPNQPVWVAPNALYPAEALYSARADNDAKAIVYVGRLVAEKKVDLLIKAFAQVAHQLGDVQLRIVGAGDALPELKKMTERLGISEKVEFTGSVTGVDKLREVYSDAFCSVSPGYVGLSLTQSLGFGVPMLVADDEPHAPEIELERFGGVARFKEDDDIALASLILSVFQGETTFPPPEKLAAPIKANYSAESMARGLLESLDASPQNLGKEGWPDDEQH